MDLFRGSETIHGTHGEPVLDDTGVKWAIKKTARTLRGPASLERWELHLTGKSPLGVVPIMNDNNCCWGSIDIDDYEVDAIDVIKRLEAAKLPLVPGRSKSGGLHLFCFAIDPVPAELMQGALRDVAASLGFAGSEIFPKQTRILVEHGDQGNWMVMPYFGGDFGGRLKFQYGLKKTGAEMTIDEFLSFAEKRRVTEAQLEELKVNRKVAVNGKKLTKVNGHAVTRGPPFSNGPPCLQHMAEGGFPADGRKRAIFMIGIFLKRAYPDNWEKMLEADNQKYMRPPLPADEITSVRKSLLKKEPAQYEYTCKEQPMASHCSSVICRGRKFGVGTGGAYPTIEALSKLTSDPPLWFVDIPGAHIAMTTEELTSYRKFHTLCVAKASVVFKLIRDDVWISILSEAVAGSTRIEASTDIGRPGIFLELLEEFLTNRVRGERKEDLLRGAPWEDEDNGRFMFPLRALESFLQREGLKDIKRPEITFMIKNLGGEHTTEDIKGRRNLNFWCVPSSAINRAPVLDAPKEKDDGL